MYDIYLITNLINQKKYVEYTSIGYEKRFQKHITESLGKSTRYLCRAIRKYGKENFAVSLLATVEKYNEAIKLEKEYILKFNSFAHVKGNWGYNATLGGEGADGHNVSRELRIKLSNLKKSQNAWVGKNNPNFGKGHLMMGDKHFLFGKKQSSETKRKISLSNKGKLLGSKNPAAVNTSTYALQIDTGVIYKADSFYALRKLIEATGVNVNRSSALAVIRGKQKFHNGFVFYRADITDKDTIEKLDYNFVNNIKESIKFEDHRNGKTHPNAKNVLSFAENIDTKEIHQFNSWYELKNFITEMSFKNVTYSNMAKVLSGKHKHISGYKLYREDKTDEVTMNMIKTKYSNQSEPSTTSRKA
jgi:group I intron endonuclease